jgi:hypothetical protein
MSQILHEQSSPPETSVEEEFGSMSIAFVVSAWPTTVDVKRAANSPNDQHLHLLSHGKRVALQRTSFAIVKSKLPIVMCGNHYVECRVAKDLVARRRVYNEVV